MAAPGGAYPIGKPARDGGDQKEIDKLSEIPNFNCTGCGTTDAGEMLLGVDDSDTLWCPVCGSTFWTWL